MTDNVRTPMASAVRAKPANVGPMAAAPPGQVNLGTCTSSSIWSSGPCVEGIPTVYPADGPAAADPRAVRPCATYAAVDGRHGRRDRRHGGPRAAQPLHHPALP